MLDNPFTCPGDWYRANLHAHTTDSDGDLSPADCAAFYRRAGYDVLAITDHWHVTDLRVEDPGFLILPGAEYDAPGPAQGSTYHMVGLNLSVRGKIARAPGASAQHLIEEIRAQGGEALIAHPYWSGLMASDVTPLRDCFAVEVYNTGCDIEILRGYSSVHWDDLLSLGWDCGAVAVDDGHRHRFDHGGAWTMIRAEELSVSAVMEALRRGRYYSSIGPEIRNLQVVGGTVRVATSPVASIALVSSPTQGGRVQAPPGETLTEAEFSLPKARYLRVEIADAQGKSAWSNPVLLEE